MTAHVLSPGVAATVAVKSCHRRDGADFERLAEYFRADLGWKALHLSVVERNVAGRAFFARLGFRPVRAAANSTGLRALILEREL